SRGRTPIVRSCARVYYCEGMKSLVPSRRVRKQECVPYISMSAFSSDCILTEPSDSRYWTKPCSDKNRSIVLSLGSGNLSLADKSAILCHSPSLSSSRRLSSRFIGRGSTAEGKPIDVL